MERAQTGAVGSACIAVGVLCVMCSLFMEWFCVPLEALDSGWEVTRPSSERSFKVVLALLSGALAISARKGRTVLACHIASLCFLTILGYPRECVVSDSTTAVNSGWFEQSHASLAWLGGDVALSQGVAEDLFLSDVLLSDSPYSFRACPNPMELSGTLGLREVSDVFGWLGFTDAFAAFVCRGWVFALAGVFLLTCTVGALSVDRGRFTRALGLSLVVWPLMGMGVALYPVVLAGDDLEAAEEFTNSGLYLAAIEKMEDASEAVPLLRFDTRFIAQAGLLRKRVGMEQDAGVRLYSARLREPRESGASSRGVYRSIVLDAEVDPSIRREAARSLARVAYISLNTGDYKEGASDLRVARVALGNDPKILLALQLVSLREGDDIGLEKQFAQAKTLYRYVNLPTRDSVLAFGLNGLARSKWAKGDASAAYELSSMKGKPR